ncbi:MAG TPA: thioredoxin family protein [Bacillota bacterium]|nr:thioredoxin family protein [Bacillota bacterium]
MIEIQSVEQWESYIQSNKLVVAKFYTNWCKDCKRIDPFMPEVVDKFSQIQFLSVDRDQFSELGEQLNVFGIPSFVAFFGGKELIRFVSREAKSQEEIESFMERTIQMVQALEGRNSL